MSAPRTNMGKQRRRHRFPLLGIGGVVGASTLLLAVFVGWLFLNAEASESADMRFDKRLGGAAETASN